MKTAEAVESVYQDPTVAVLTWNVHGCVGTDGKLDVDRVAGETPVVRSFPSRLPLLALDRIWVRPRVALKLIKTHRDPLARLASDHLPVYAEVMR